MIPELCHREGLGAFDVTVHRLKPGETLPHTVSLPHGRVFDLSLPRLTNLDGDVFAVRLTCEKPARKPTLDGLTPLAPETHERLTLALYRAYAAAPDPRPTYDVWSRAAQAGVRMAPAAPRLTPWTPIRPSVPADLRRHLYPPPESLPQDRPCFLMDLPRLSAPLAQTVKRAIEGAQASFFRPNPLCEGYDWYSDIPEIARVTFHFKDESGWRQVGRTPLPGGRLVEEAQVRFHRRRTQGFDPSEGVLLRLPTDLLLFGDEGEPAWASVRDALLGAEGTGKRLFEAFRDPGADRLDDLDLRARFNLEAADLLGSFDEQTVREIRRAMKRSLAWLAPYGRTYWLATDGADVRATLMPEPESGFRE